MRHDVTCAVHKYTFTFAFTSQDVLVSVVRQVQGGTPTRQREERRLILQLGTLTSGGLNIDFNQVSLIRLQNRDSVRAQYLSGASTP